jgi:hypothetical protein
MYDAHDCHDRAEALATLALMYPEDAERYREKERRWRDLETRALAQRTAAALVEGFGDPRKEGGGSAPADLSRG